MTSIPPASRANLRGAVDLSSLVRPPAAPAGSAPGPAASVPSLVVESSDASFTAILDLSQTVPVVVELYVGEPSATLIRAVTSYAGRLVLATVDAAANPQLTQAFHAAAAPTVAAVVGGRPIALYEGELPEADVKQVLDQLLTLAAQQNVTGTVEPPEPGAEPAEPVEEPLPPHHQEAYDAIAAGDFDTAIREYKTAIAQDPRDQLAVAGLAQVSLLSRLGSASAAEIRDAAAAAPTDVDAQLAVADLDTSGGHLEDAFGRLLDLFPTLDQPGKDRVRTRLLDFFEIAGGDDPRVVSARRRLTGLLY
ncbi:tetratricopeptide repeat protein [Glaciihabitans sp. INWT7]|uniref:co-chaperone YbbN n=1 Tax=Glaciihabitans sp. INWT7 TaxID=2596912 RepID=UPI0016288765|nr:tetratricopeptide repeat protein [Glaciihabitans sp. INWT7]QNE47356.1 tetratricopeptide repeat protein [Glaciihabitans sp. INWT7]